MRGSVSTGSMGFWQPINFQIVKVESKNSEESQIVASLDFEKSFFGTRQLKFLTVPLKMIMGSTVFRNHLKYDGHASSQGTKFA